MDSTNSTLLFVVALLGATVCADTRDTASSERHITSKRRGRKAAAIAASEEVMAAEVQVEFIRDTKSIVSGRKMED